MEKVRKEGRGRKKRVIFFYFILIPTPSLTKSAPWTIF